jgi:acetyl-CoA synthetase
MSDHQQLKDTFPFGQPFVWYPSQDVIASSNLQKFMNRHQISDYDSLMTRSINEIELRFTDDQVH